MTDQRYYKQFLQEISRFIPRERIYTDELRRLAWGTDAGFYRLIPQVVIRSENEQEVSGILAIASHYQLFAQKKPDFIHQIKALRDLVHKDTELVERIWHKYAIKNVTGLNIQPFIVFEDPFDIIAHLMVGSEGTLAFLSEVTMRTAYDHPYKASAMLYFSDIKEACRAVVAMKQPTNAQGEFIVKGAELLDKKSLESVNDSTGIGLTAVLTETMAVTKEELNQNIAVIAKTLEAFNTYIPVHFTDKESEYSKYWAIRSGIFPSVGGTRKPGTTCLIEDVAFHIENLPEATLLLAWALPGFHWLVAHGTRLVAKKCLSGLAYS